MFSWHQEDLSQTIIPEEIQDDERIWDELKLEQNREIQQHHHRAASASCYGISSTTDGRARGGIITNAIQAVMTLFSPKDSLQDQRQSSSLSGGAKSNSIASTASSSCSLHNLSEFGIHPMEIDAGGDAYAALPTNEENKDTPLLPNDYQQQQHRPSSEKDENNQNKRDFVFLPTFRLPPKQDGWGAVSNLDLFFTSLYNYYYHRGLKSLIGKGLVELISLFFTLFLSVFLFAYLDWSNLLQCNNEHTCHDTFQQYIIQKPFSKITPWSFLILIYALLFSIYGILSILSFLVLIQNALHAKSFYENKLGISSRKLEGGAIEWDDIVQKIINLQRTGEYRIAIHDDAQTQLDALVISQRIMRKDNFMVAFMNMNILDLSVPLLGKPHPSNVFLSKSLEWSLYFCILSYMFNHKYQLRPAFIMDPFSLKRRFVICGVIQAIFLPFLLLFMMLYFFFQNTHEWKSTHQYLGPREWSNTSKWMFREFNELPHIFERRLGPSYEAAEKYLELFTPSTIMTSIGRMIVFISGSLLSVLVALAAVNDSILLHVKLGPWNLFWYVGIIGVCFTTGKGLIPNTKIHPSYIHNFFAQMDTALSNVATYTHYFPEDWKGRAYKSRTKSEFSAMFQNKAKLFLYEILSVVFTPLVLCISLPKCAEEICNFVHKATMEVPGAGDVCGFSSFDFDSFEDENWENKDDGDDDNNLSRKRSPEVVMKLRSRPRTKMRKMEKSFFSFKAVHPSWKCHSSGQNLLDRVGSYQKKQEMALAKERQHHIEAATRQLETLMMMEQQKQQLQQQRNLEAKRTTATIPGVTNIAKQNNEQQTIHEDSIGSTHLMQQQQLSTSSLHISPPTTTNLETELSSHTLTPPTTNLATASSHIPTTATTNLAAAMSVLHYADAGLSTELQRILNQSTLDLASSRSNYLHLSDYQFGADSSSLMSNLHMDGSTTSRINNDAETQYLWLEKYRSHLAELQQQNDPNNNQNEM